jgi:hypothetical protein
MWGCPPIHPGRTIKTHKSVDPSTHESSPVPPALDRSVRCYSRFAVLQDIRSRDARNRATSANHKLAYRCAH